MLSKISLVTLSALGLVNGAGKTPYAYLLNGADWPSSADASNQCDGDNQSPIDLRTDIHSSPFTKGDGTEFTPNYQNIAQADVLNLGMVVQLNFPDVTEMTSPDNNFNSEYAADELGSSPKFGANQFHFHAQSEHTINGKRYDMEMHTVHFPEGDARRRLEEKATTTDVKIIASAVGLMFDRYNYDKSITADERLIVDQFFDSMGFTEEVDPDSDGKQTLRTKQDVPYGDLLMMQNFANRWVYTGSLTTHPCTIGVYFQVVERVLPISERHYNAYIAHQKKYKQKYFFNKKGEVCDLTKLTDSCKDYGLTQTDLDVTGNWRITNKVGNHNVRYMRADLSSDEDTDLETTTAILGVLLALSVIVAVVLAVCAIKQMKDAKNTLVDSGADADKMENEGGEEMDKQEGPSEEVHLTKDNIEMVERV